MNVLKETRSLCSSPKICEVVSTRSSFQQHFLNPGLLALERPRPRAVSSVSGVLEAEPCGLLQKFWQSRDSASFSNHRSTRQPSCLTTGMNKQGAIGPHTHRAWALALRPRMPGGGSLCSVPWGLCSHLSVCLQASPLCLTSKKQGSIGKPETSPHGGRGKLWGSRDSSDINVESPQGRTDVSNNILLDQNKNFTPGTYVRPGNPSWLQQGWSLQCRLLFIPKYLETVSRKEHKCNL